MPNHNKLFREGKRLYRGGGGGGQMRIPQAHIQMSWILVTDHVFTLTIVLHSPDQCTSQTHRGAFCVPCCVPLDAA